jgi:hypothetical protein
MRTVHKQLYFVCLLAFGAERIEQPHGKIYQCQYVDKFLINDQFELVTQAACKYQRRLQYGLDNRYYRCNQGKHFQVERYSDTFSTTVAAKRFHRAIHGNHRESNQKDIRKKQEKQIDDQFEIVVCVDLKPADRTAHNEDHQKYCEEQRSRKQDNFTVDCYLCKQYCIYIVIINALEYDKHKQQAHHQNTQNDETK